jgi:hypothetical protein
MRWRAPARVVALSLGVVLGALACGLVSLTDAELVWCKANLSAVAASAESLRLPPPDANQSWSAWAAVLIAGEQLFHGSQWDAMTIERDRPNRDRACRAAYESR